MCRTGTWTNITDSSDVYQCSLEENAYVSFQHGDLIVLILPPLKDAKFLLYFTAESGPTNYIYFQENGTKLKQVATENAQPQLTLGIRSMSTDEPDISSSSPMLPTSQPAINGTK